MANDQEMLARVDERVNGLDDKLGEIKVCFKNHLHHHLLFSLAAFTVTLGALVTMIITLATR